MERAVGMAVRQGELGRQSPRSSTPCRVTCSPPDSDFPSSRRRTSLSGAATDATSGLAGAEAGRAPTNQTAPPRKTSPPRHKAPTAVHSVKRRRESQAMASATLSPRLPTTTSARAHGRISAARLSAVASPMRRRRSDSSASKRSFHRNSSAEADQPAEAQEGQAQPGASLDVERNPLLAERSSTAFCDAAIGSSGSHSVARPRPAARRSCCRCCTRTSCAPAASGIYRLPLSSWSEQDRRLLQRGVARSVHRHGRGRSAFVIDA